MVCLSRIDVASRLPDNVFVFFFNDTATTEIYTLSLHDALPICPELVLFAGDVFHSVRPTNPAILFLFQQLHRIGGARSEEHTSELQSLAYLVCRLLLEKKKIDHNNSIDRVVDDQLHTTPLDIAL